MKKEGKGGNRKLEGKGREGGRELEGGEKRKGGNVRVKEEGKI